MRIAAASALTVLLAAILAAQTPRPFQLDEATIADIHAAFRGGSLTCRSLVEQYLKRIEADDKQGAALNAIVMVNPRALDVADDLDRRFRQSGPVGPMHCVPVIVKDNFETVEMPTTAGSLSLKGMMTGKDAFVVKRLRDAGAVMIAKSNMAEFAFSPVETVNSILPGYSRNPYDRSRVTAGSSGGSAAAAAANFGAIALASDTGDSIRGPAAHQALVGLRSTMGLVSRAGRRAAEPRRRHRRRRDPNRRRHRSGTAGDCRRRSGRSGDRGRRAARWTRTTRRRCAATVSRARGSACCIRPTTRRRSIATSTRYFAACSASCEIWAPRSSTRWRSRGWRKCAPRRPARCNQFKYDLNRYLAGLGR